MPNRIQVLLAVVIVGFFSSTSAFAIGSKCKAQATALADLVANPKEYLGKKLTISGTFYAFTTLPLDYEKAMRSSKENIGIVLSRPDQIDIPLVELKMSVPLKIFKETSINLEHGDKVELAVKVFAVELGEAWLDIEDMEVEHIESKS